MISNKRALFAAFLLSLSCGQPASDEGGHAALFAATSSSASALPSSKAEPRHGMEGEDDVVPSERFTGGAKAFAEVRDALLAHYYAEGLGEDDVYRAATAGMLERLEPRMKKYNKLMSPTEIAEIKNDLKGEVVGVGLQIQFDEKSGYADVIGTLASSPAEKAGLVLGDKIVTVNGKLYKGMRTKDVVADIRGKAGDPVTLSVLREGKLLSFSLVRARVAYDSPVQTVLPDHVGYVRIPSFTERTPTAVRASLEELEHAGVRSLVVDLRQCPGGLFERALETAGIFVPEGTPVVLLKRHGKPDEKHLSKGTPILADVPLAVLVDNGTASGAEFLASALRDARHARLVGARTHGKWSVQKLEDLPNGFAYKFTIGVFETASGKTYEGVGLSPDVESTMEDGVLPRAQALKPEERLAADVQLRTAKELLVR